MSTTPGTSSARKKSGVRKRNVYFDENAPKRPRTAYVHFINARRKEMAENGEHELLRQRTLLVEMAKQWKSLSEEEKKSYFDKSAKENAEYEKAMEEYKKTDAYSQFQAKKKKLMKERMLELKRLKSGIKSSDDEEEEENGEAAVEGDIPIFSKEFLTYNKGQESKIKKMRQTVSALQEENDLLRADIAKLSDRVELLHGGQRETVRWATKIKQRWAKLLIDALAYVSVDGEYPTLQNIDIYMRKLKNLVAENPSSEDLIAVRLALSEVNFA